MALAALLATFNTPGHAAPAADLAAGDLRRSGTIELAITCDPEVRKEFETSVALLHSFFYDEARRRFLEIAERDPKCAMAWWGVAMTWFHPLWAPPTIVERACGLTAIEKAKAIGVETELERGLIEAVAAYYTATETPAFEKKIIAGCSCCGPQAHSARATAFHSRMEELHRRFPDHLEVATFYALAKLGTVDPTDKTFAKQREAGELLEPLFQANPEHPGIAHYIIHAYDYPELAARALAVARRYDDIAPWVPHALHMPTHIYTRLGLWEDSIEGNIASSQAARDYAGRFYEGGTTMDDLHAMDYLMFAYQQTARDSEARALLDHLEEIREIVPGNDFASAYAIAAMPARDCVERKAWKEAIGLEVPHRAFVARFPFALAHIEFARAVGAARTGELETAERTVRELARLRDSVEDLKFQWWTDQIEIQRLAAEAWLAHARDRHTEAEELFRKAATIEDKAGTHPVTPGQILPVREQLGEMLLEIGKPSEAFAEFERSLEAFPRRFHSHLGAARAAGRIGRHDSAREHASALIEMAGERAERPGLIEEMRAILASAGSE